MGGEPRPTSPGAREGEPGDVYVSTGHLPPATDVAALVAEAHARFAAHDEGEVSRVYPALARAPRDLFGLCVAGADGRLYAAGDAEVPFALMSVAKPFVFALACEALGPEAVRERVGVNPTGLPFNAPEAVERSPDGRTNPMVNPGAIATTSLVAGRTAAEKWESIVDGLSRFAGRPLALDEETYASASATNHRNRELTTLLEERRRVYCDPAEALDLYTRQSCVSVTATDLAVMGATLADGGVNPLTGVRVVDRTLCHHVLVVMTVAGLYETSGDWLYDVGLPAKSGIGGGIVTVSPGKGGLGTYAPPLDAAGNSVRGRLAARFLSRRLGMDLYASRPVVSPSAPARR
jgi:glutaminase